MKGFALTHPAPVSERPLVWMNLPAPEPGPDEVLVRVSTCAICRTDLHVVEGDLEVRRANVTPGHQVVGVIERVGSEVRDLAPGARVGVAWLHRTCGRCRFCRSQRENLCDAPEFTGWTVPGGFAELVVAPAAFVYRVPDEFDDVQAAPLLCAGIIGYRSLRLTGLGDDPAKWTGARLGLYGFGAAGHIALQIARARGAEVYVLSRDRERHRALAAELGATWVGGAGDELPVRLDASIVFAPAGEIVPSALDALDKGGTLVLGGIHMSDIPALPYEKIYSERVIRSVANHTREDGRRFLAEAAAIPVRTHVERFPLEQANEALIALRHDAIRGAGVLEVTES